MSPLSARIRELSAGACQGTCRHAEANGRLYACRAKSSSPFLHPTAIACGRRLHMPPPFCLWSTVQGRPARARLFALAHIRLFGVRQDAARAPGVGAERWRLADGRSARGHPARHAGAAAARARHEGTHASAQRHDAQARALERREDAHQERLRLRIDQHVSRPAREDAGLLAAWWHD
eukprot:4867563-Pleurochrysis_carterae.AAC.1